jgi:hypothetical protein
MAKSCCLAQTIYKSVIDDKRRRTTFGFHFPEKVNFLLNFGSSDKPINQ